MMLLSEKLTARSSTSGGGRWLFMVLTMGMALAMALSMTFADDAQAKKNKKKKKRKPPATYLPAPANCNQPLVYNGESSAWAWGEADEGRLGVGTTEQDRVDPYQVLGYHPTLTPASSSNNNNSSQASFQWDQYLSGLKTVAAGTSHSLALKEDGTVRAWGLNVNGQLGDGEGCLCDTEGYTPVEVLFLDDVEAIAAGGHHSLAIKREPPEFAPR